MSGSSSSSSPPEEQGPDFDAVPSVDIPRESVFTPLHLNFWLPHVSAHTLRMHIACTLARVNTRTDAHTQKPLQVKDEKGREARKEAAALCVAEDAILTTQTVDPVQLLRRVVGTQCSEQRCVGGVQ